MQCEVWRVACEDFASSLAEKKAACRGKDTVGTGCLRTIGHLFLGNFRRRLARVLVLDSSCSPFKDEAFPDWCFLWMHSLWWS